jgi:hypothetical protein
VWATIFVWRFANFPSKLETEFNKDRILEIKRLKIEYVV